MTELSNPYAAPKAHIEDKLQPYSVPLKKVKSPRVIGIVLLILTPIGLFGMLSTLYMAANGLAGVQAAWAASGMSMTYIYVTYGVGLLMSLWVFFIAIQLLRYKEQGRKHYNYYFIASVIFSGAAAIYQFVSIPATVHWVQPMLSTGISLLFTLGLLFVFWYFLNKKRTKACLT